MVVQNPLPHAMIYKVTNSALDQTEFHKLLEHLDGLPLAIAHAGAYLHESGTTIKKYLQLCEEQLGEVVEVLEGWNRPLNDYPNRNVATTWIISYKAVLAKEEHVAHMLVLWSFLARNDLWYGMFEEAASGPTIAQALSKWLGSIATNEMSFIRAMRTLRNYSLIDGADHTEGYAMHTVVHRWAYSYLGFTVSIKLRNIGAFVGWICGANTHKTRLYPTGTTFASSCPNMFYQSSSFATRREVVY